MTTLQRLLPVSGRDAAHELDFLPAALEIIERPASPAGRALSLSVCTLLSSAILWACLGKLDIVATAPGQILPLGNSKLIQPLETGVIAGIDVADGQHVRANQVLITLDPTTVQADQDKLALDLTKTRLDIARLEGLRDFIAVGSAELKNPPSVAPAADLEAAAATLRVQMVEQQKKLAGLDQQIAGKAAEQAEAQAGIDKLQASIPLVGQQAELRRKLKEMEFGNKLAWLEAEERLVSQRHDLPALIHRRSQAVAAGQSLLQQRDQLRAEFEKTVLSDLAQAKQKAAEIEKERDKNRQRLSLLTLRSPIDGTVQQLAVHTVGGVVTPAQSLTQLPHRG